MAVQHSSSVPPRLAAGLLELKSGARHWNCSVVFVLGSQPVPIGTRQSANSVCFFNAPVSNGEGSHLGAESTKSHSPEVHATFSSASIGYSVCAQPFARGPGYLYSCHQLCAGKWLLQHLKPISRRPLRTWISRRQDH